MTLDPELLAELPSPARQDAGRAWNAFVRMKQAEHEVALARQDYSTYLIKLRGVHRLSVRNLARLFGRAKDHILRYSAAYQEPEYRGPPRADPDAPGRGRRDLSSSRRQPWQLAGARSAPGSEPSVARTERIVRELTGE